MALRLTYKKIFAGLAALLLAFGFLILGFVASRHTKPPVRSDVRKAYLARVGDATPSDRSSVLVALREFQDGYVKRDPKELDTFMNLLFVKDEDVLLLGTDSGEWIRGYSAVSEFIRTDWTSWGDFRFSVDDSIVWCAGDVAWIVSIGTVGEHGSERPVRFSAILTRHGSNWHFRQMHFQWDDSAPDDVSLRHPRTYFTLLKRVLQAVWGTARNTSAGQHSTATYTAETAVRSRMRARIVAAAGEGLGNRQFPNRHTIRVEPGTFECTLL